MRQNLFGSPINARGDVLGCAQCPLDGTTRKMLGLTRVTGRRAMLWSQQPGPEDTKGGLEMTGPPGELLWRALRPMGLGRESFDIQSVVRCRPVGDRGVDRPPVARELQCCSPYNDEALRLNRGTAVVHLVLGETAGIQLLGSEFRKDAPVVWHEPWDAYAVLVPHPKFILTQGAEKAPWSWRSWVSRFQALRAVLDHPGRYGHLLAQDNRTVRTPREFDEMERDLRSEQKLGRRVSFDIEDDSWGGEVRDNRMLVAGFGTGSFKDPADFRSWTGRNWSVVLDHPESGHTPRSLRAMQDRVKALVEDATLKKALQNGASDTEACKVQLGARLRGYDYDTQHGTYLRYSFLRSCKLEDLTSLFFPEFCDYKGVVDPWSGDYSKAPLDKLLLRNQGDVAVTKRLEARFSPEVRQPLVKVYIHAGMTLSKMESRGPVLDQENWDKAEAAVPKMLKKLDTQLGGMALEGGEHSFTCTDAQVATLVYDTLGIKPVKVPVRTGSGRPVMTETRSTGKVIMQQLEAERPHAVFPLVAARRALSKIKGTYMEGYARCAKLFGGELRTRWKLNTVTGRLTSSGNNEGGMNLQNLHGNKLLQNMLVSCRNWRDAILGALDDILDLEVFLVVDCSQAEIRALAELSGDPVMIRLLQEAAADRKNKMKDFHSLNGHMLTGRPIEQISTDKGLRRSVKNLIFGIIFGKAEGGMYEYVVQKIRAVEGKDADLTGITKPRIAALYKKFFSVYGGIRKWIEKQRDLAERLGYVETLFGFRRHIRSDDTERKTYAGNQAINSPVQGTAHTYMLIALALLDLKPVTYNRLLKCIMEVHDALYFKVKLRHLVEAHAQLISLFETDTVEYARRAFGLKLRVPLLVDAEAGFCMGSLVGYEGAPLPEFLAAWRAKHAETDKKSWEDFMPDIEAPETV